MVRRVVSTGSRSWRRFRGLLLLAAVLCFMAVASGAAAQTAAGGVEVDPALGAALSSTDAGVAAVITTWSYEDLDAVEALDIPGVRLRALPMWLATSLTSAQLDALVSLPGVRSVYANHHYELLTEDSSWIVRAREVWLPPDEGGYGITGDGAHVAVIDTGADGHHEDMDQLVEFCETTQAATSNNLTVLCSPFDPASGNAGSAGATDDPRLDSTDDEGHGSHVSGTIAGSGDASGGREAFHSTIGMAPDALLHVYSANVGPSLANHEILAAYDDLIVKKRLGLNEVVAVSNSWGGGAGSNYSPEDPVHVAIETAYDAGILSVFAAGNDGPEHNTLSRQCVSPYVVCVAASTKNDSVVMFSSRGRPSEPADTNRDGIVGGEGDVSPDNHDRALGQALGLGLYRPTVAAPGVNINAISANAPACRELGLDFDTGCYEVLNGTSMATPHVTGVVALITQAYRQGHNGETPTPAILTDILERSANVSKLAGYESEEQGAGRLNAWAAVEYALSYPEGLPPVNWGTATAPTTDGGTLTTTGCTAALSYSTGTGVAQHTLQVPEGAERLRITADWSAHPTANLYLRLWRPDVDPDAETEPAGPDRVFPDQESLGLVYTLSNRWLDVRAPEAGEWTLRVYHRAGGVPAACDPNSTEEPKQSTGYNYDLTVVTPLAVETPQATITSPRAEDTLTTRFVPIEGEASYPTPWDGVSNWNVPGSGPDTELPEDRLVLTFQGNVEEGCSGDGASDVVLCDGPMLAPNSTLSVAPAASWKVADPLFNGTNDRNIYDPNWIWHLGQPTTVSGPMTVEFWAGCAACSQEVGLSADWTVRLWADGTLITEQRLSATPLLPDVPSKLELTIDVPRTTANESLVLHVDPVYIDSQIQTHIYYDSALPCPGVAGGACDSRVHMPVVDASSAAPPDPPANVRVTDIHSGLRVTWDGVAGATSYSIYRSTDPGFDAASGTPLATTSGTSYEDTTVDQDRVYYYRVVADGDSGQSDASLLAYGMATAYDRQVKVGFDRLWGPRVWEYATLRNAAATLWEAVWDTLQVEPLVGDILARSFTQGIGSANAHVQAGDPPPPEGDAIMVQGGGKVPGANQAEDARQATFGVVVKADGDTVSGALNFKDHEMNVRIRATRFDALTVDGNNCTISGLAEVTRGGDRTEEAFTAHCTDNGEPGSEDVFTISTDSYSGGGQLTGGNITIENGN